ncbi:hypothetical protein L7F22_056245 [Adiantum nelumboides]|nr:hypothetical protein [Adiantum nelumboides]
MSATRLQEALARIGPMAQLFGQSEAPMMISTMSPAEHRGADGSIATEPSWLPRRAPVAAGHRRDPGPAGEPGPAGRARRDLRPRLAGDGRLPPQPRGHRGGVRARLAPHRRHRPARRRRLPHIVDPAKDMVITGGFKRVLRRGGAGPDGARRRPGLRGGRPARREVGRTGHRGGPAPARCRDRHRGTGRHHMKLALYLPNFRDLVTVKELEDLTALAEDLDFDSVWTLDRIVVPEKSDRQELQYSFGMMDGLPNALPVSSRGKWFQGYPLIPWLAAKTTKVRIGMSIIDTPFRSPGVLAAELATIDHLSGGRLNVGVGSGWMPEEFAAASAAHIFPKRHKHVRESIEIMQGVWDKSADHYEFHGEFADFEACGFGHKPLQDPRPPIFMSASRTRCAPRAGSPSTTSTAGSASRTRPRPRQVDHRHRRAVRGDRQPEAGQGPRDLLDDLDGHHRRGGRPDRQRRRVEPAGGHREAAHRPAQGLQGGGHDHAADLAAVRRRPGVEDARRPQADQERHHAEGARLLSTRAGCRPAIPPWADRGTAPQHRVGGSTSRVGPPTRGTPHGGDTDDRRPLEPVGGAHRAVRVARLPGLAGRAGGPPVRRPRRPARVVGRRRRPVLALGSSTTTTSRSRRRGSRSAPRTTCRTPVVHRGPAELGRARAAPRRRRRPRPGVCAGGWGARPEITWSQLRRSVAAAAGWLRRAGVRPGDRVCAYLPNTEHAVIGLLAAASVGAVWSCCSPDFGAEGTIGRLAQLEPTVLIAADGYHWNGRDVDRARRRRAAAGRAAATVRHVVPSPTCSTARPRGHDRGTSCSPSTAEPEVHAGRVLAPAVGAVHLRHHRPAEGPRARPRRHHPRRA